MTRARAPLPNIPNTRTVHRRGAARIANNLTAEKIKTFDTVATWEAAGANRDVFRIAHRAGALVYTGQIRYSAISSTGLGTITICAPSATGEQGLVLRDDGQTQGFGTLSTYGYAAHRFNAAGANEWGGVGVGYGAYAVLAAAPSSITLGAPIGADVNVNAVGVANISARGFRFEVQSAGAGDTSANRHWVSNP